MMEGHPVSSSDVGLTYGEKDVEEPEEEPEGGSQNRDITRTSIAARSETLPKRIEKVHSSVSGAVPKSAESATKNVPDPFSNPVYQAAYDFGCGCTIALMVGAKIFTFAILVFQASPEVRAMRSSVTNSAAIGVIVMTIMMMCKSRYPYVVIVPDMFSAPYIIQMSYQLVSDIDDEKAAYATILVLVLLVYSLSGILHILMATFRMLRFAEFLPYPVFCGLFSAVGLTIVQRSILFAPGYQIIPTTVVAISLSLKIFKTKETRPALTFMTTSIISTSIFYIVARIKKLSIGDLRALGWLVENPTQNKELNNQLVPWLLWIHGDSPIRFELVQWELLIVKYGASICFLLILIALRRSMQLANLNRLFACRAKTNRELALHGYSQLFASFLGTFGGVFSGPDMVRIKRMHGGEVFPGVVSVFVLICITFSRFFGVDYVPKFVFTGILASEGIMMLDRFLFMPYRLAGIVEWIAVVIIAITAFFDIFKGFFVGAAISLMLFSVRFYRTGCVKMTGTGLTMRSTVDRSDVAYDWLSSHGEKIRVIQLRGTVAFANVPSVLDVVADILDLNPDKSKPLNSPQRKFLLWLSLLKSMIQIELNRFGFMIFLASRFDDWKKKEKHDDENDNNDSDIDDVYYNDNNENSNVTFSQQNKYYRNEESTDHHTNIKAESTIKTKKNHYNNDNTIEIKGKKETDIFDESDAKKDIQLTPIITNNKMRASRPRLALESMFTPPTTSEKRELYDVENPVTSNEGDNEKVDNTINSPNKIRILENKEEKFKKITDIYKSNIVTSNNNYVTHSNDDSINSNNEKKLYRDVELGRKESGSSSSFFWNFLPYSKTSKRQSQNGNKSSKKAFFGRIFDFLSKKSKGIDGATPNPSFPHPAHPAVTRSLLPPEHVRPVDPWDDFFRPEFLIVDMALVVAVDASALDHFKQIADFCKKSDVSLFLSGLEAHLDLLVKSGVFKKENRYGDLDTALCTCEDELLLKYHVDDDDDTDDETDDGKTDVVENDNIQNSKNENDRENEIEKSINGYKNGEEKDDENDSHEGTKMNINNYNIRNSENIESYIKNNQQSRQVNDLENSSYQNNQNNQNNIEISKSSARLISKPHRKLHGEKKEKKGFSKCLEIMRERYNLSDTSVVELERLVDYTRPLRLLEGEIIMHTTQGSPVDLDEDGLFFIQSGSVVVQRDADQSVLLTIRSCRRKRLSVAPRVLRLKHRTFQLNRLSAGYLLGANELCSRYRSLGQFVVKSKVCRAHFLPFRAILNFERDHPLLALKVFQLAAMVLADGYDRSKEQLSHLVDTIYAPPMKVSTATEKALKKARGTFDKNGMKDPRPERSPFTPKSGPKEPTWDEDMEYVRSENENNNNSNNGSGDSNINNNRNNITSTRDDDDCNNIKGYNSNNNICNNSNQNNNQNKNKNSFTSYGLFNPEYDRNENRLFPSESRPFMNESYPDSMSSIGSVVGVDRNPLIAAVKKQIKTASL